MGFEIVEWRNSMNERVPSHLGNDFNDLDGMHLINTLFVRIIENASTDDRWIDTEALFDKFQAFLKRASACHNIFSTQSPASTSSGRPSKRHLILLEDLPNILHFPTQVRFHSALQSLCGSSEVGPPLVIITSDSGLRGENTDDAWDGTGSTRWSKKETIDFRSVLGVDLCTSPYVTRIAFNPIAPTLMTKALQAMLTTHFASTTEKPPTKDIVEMIVESSNGDIRSAVMALEFACVVTLSMKGAGKGRRGNAAGKGGARAVLEAVTRREQSLVLFHLMGKILYNKREYTHRTHIGQS
jgi:cell cycle checkpoint protein